MNLEFFPGLQVPVDIYVEKKVVARFEWDERAASWVATTAHNVLRFHSRSEGRSCQDCAKYDDPTCSERGVVMDTKRPPCGGPNWRVKA